MSLIDETIAAEGAILTTPSDSTDLFYGICRGIWVGTAGDVAVVTPKGMTVTYPSVVAGLAHPIKAKRILSTGTTAITVLALY